MSNSVLVLGASGVIGRRLVPQLVARGLNVRAASRHPKENQVRFDWDNSASHQPALAGIDAVYLIAPALVEDPSAVVRSFLNLAKQAGVARVVAVSSLATGFALEKPDSGRTKLESLVKESGLEWTILRPSGFNQNFSEGFMLPGILQAGMVATVTGDGAVAFVDANDIAAVAAATLTEPGHAGKTYIVTGPEAITFADAMATVSRIAGRTITHRTITPAELTQILLGAGVPDDYAAMLVRDQEGIRDGFGALVTNVVAELTGRPATRFADFAAQSASSWEQS